MMSEAQGDCRIDRFDHAAKNTEYGVVYLNRPDRVDVLTAFTEYLPACLPAMTQMIANMIALDDGRLAACPMCLSLAVSDCTCNVADGVILRTPSILTMCLLMACQSR